MKRAISKAISVLTGGVAGAVAGGVAIERMMSKKTKEKDEIFKKVLSYYFLYDRWLNIRQQGKSLAEYFEKNGYKNIAIYGLKELGVRLFDELKDSNITVKYIIDKNADALHADVDVVTPDNTLEPVDAIVVTAVYYFDNIEDMLYDKIDCQVVSLEEVLYEI